jgi:hypothetical protein
MIESLTRALGIPVGLIAVWAALGLIGTAIMIRRSPPVSRGRFFANVIIGGLCSLFVRPFMIPIALMTPRTKNGDEDSHD